MTVGQLRASLALWQRRERFRKSQHTLAVKGGNPLSIARWGDLLREARRNVVLREKQLAEHEGATPRMITAGQLGLRFQNLFGALGPELYLTGHHTAGPKDQNDPHAVALCRQYHAEHAAKGWGGIGYHWCIARSGTIICLRPVRLKGAHVGAHNSNNAGVMFHGTTGDLPTPAQHASYAWLRANAHTFRMPAAHRTDRKLLGAKLRGHRDWAGHESNACPGTHHPMILAGK